MTTNPTPDPTAVWVDGDPLMEAIAAAVWERCERSDSGLVIDDPRNIAAVAAAVSVPPPAPRADALREAADFLRDAHFRDGLSVQEIGTAMRHWADREEQPSAGEQQNETPEATLAAALDGLHTLIATSSRDWGQYRVDAWLWAVLCGWDCEEGHEHDELCDDGAAMREMAEQHGWDDDTVAKARRYRAAVRALTKPAAGVRQDGAQQ